MSRLDGRKAHWNIEVRQNGVRAVSVAWDGPSRLASGVFEVEGQESVDGAWVKDPEALLSAILADTLCSGEETGEEFSMLLATLVAYAKESPAPRMAVISVLLDSEEVEIAS